MGQCILVFPFHARLQPKDKSVNKIANLFIKGGGIFLSQPAEIEKKIRKLRAFVFDWDGVFTDSSKRGKNESYFTEVDSMGMNMLRFSNWMLNKKKMPFTAVMSGEDNLSARLFSTREHLHGVYFKAKNKRVALDHFCRRHGLKYSEIGFVYDDILDLSVAERVGVRILVNRKASPLLTEYVRKHNLADYITGSECGDFPLREAMELMIGLAGNYDTVVKERISHSAIYEEYIKKRNLFETEFFLLKGNKVSEV